MAILRATNQPTGSGKSKRMNTFGQEISGEKEMVLLGLGLTGYFKALARRQTTGNSEKSYCTKENVMTAYLYSEQHCLLIYKNIVMKIYWADGVTE